MTRLNYPLATVKYRGIIYDPPWAGPDKVNCPVVTSVGWWVNSSDPVKVVGALEDQGSPCVILAFPCENCLDISALFPSA